MYFLKRSEGYFGGVKTDLSAGGRSCHEKCWLLFVLIKDKEGWSVTLVTF